MLLSDKSIKEAINSGKIVITPYFEDCVQPSSIDIHLDSKFLLFNRAKHGVIDVKQKQDELMTSVEIKDGEPFMLHPGEFVLGSTLESIKLPSDIAGRIEGKSSLGRLGLLIHSSLPFDELVAAYADGKLEFLPIGKIVRERLSIKVASFHPRTLKMGLFTVTDYIENPPDKIFEIRFRSGRKINVTAGHNLFTVNEEGAIASVRCLNLKKGTFAAVPAEMPLADEPYFALNVESIFKETSNPGNVIVHSPALTRLVNKNRGAFADMTDRMLEYSQEQGKLGLQSFLQLEPSQNLPNDAHFCFKGSQSHTQLPLNLEVDEDLAWCLGLFVAEGHHRRKQINFANYDPLVRERVNRYFGMLGIDTYSNDHGVTVPSSLVSSFFAGLGLNKHAAEKRIPRVVFSFSRKNLIAFFDGMITGDGLAREERISYWTTSFGLVNDLLYLCVLLGLRASYSKRIREGSSATYEVTIPKNQHKILNTIPIPNAILVQMRKDANLTMKQAAAGLGLKYAGRIWNVEHKYKWQSMKRQSLKSLFNLYKSNIDGKKSMPIKKLIEGDILFDEVVEVIDTGRVERTYDLEVRENGEKLGNFVAGFGGVIVSNTAGYVDPGWEGNLTLELSNVSPLPITLYYKMKIGQISFTQMSTPVDKPYGSKGLGSHYQGQKVPVASKFHEEF